jgi:tetratricopeptide (TPR) repeat protein
MVQLMSWRPINFDRWRNLSTAIQDKAPLTAVNLAAAVARIELSWERLRQDLLDLFLPSGPEGTHAYHHFHTPADPEVRERVTTSAAVDYETALVFLEVALNLTTRCMSSAAGLPMKCWRKLAEAAERGDPGLPATARDTILYLQRTVLHARHKGIIHPHDHIPLMSYDNVGNVLFWRINPQPEVALIEDLDALLREARPELRRDAKVGKDIPLHMALMWLGSASNRVTDPERLSQLKERLGYLLPGPQEVAAAVDRMVDAFIRALPLTDFARLAFLSRPTTGEKVEAQEVAAPLEPANPELVKQIEDYAVTAGHNGRHREAAEGFQRVLDLDPERGGAHLNLARALLQLDQPEKAIEHLQMAAAIDAPPSEVQRDLIRAHFNAAAKAFNRGDLPAAIANYRRVCELAPDDREARRHLAVALVRSGRVDAALAQVAELDLSGSEDAATQLDIGIVLAVVGRYELARERFELALTLRPGWDEPRAQLKALPSG